MAVNMNDYELIEKGLYQHKADSTKWVARYTADGKRKRKVFTIPKDSKSNMKRYAILKLSTLIGTKTPSKITINEIFLDWITPKEKHLSLGTIKLHKYTFKNHLAPFVGDTAVVELSSMDITKLLSRDISTRTKKKITEILIPLFDYAIDNEIVEKNPIKPSHRIKRNALNEKKKVTNAVVKYKAVYKEIMNLDNIVHRALMLFGLHGRRKSETLLLEWNDIYQDTYIVRSENNKVSEDMIYTMPDDLKPILKELKAQRVSKYLFESPKIAGQPLTDIRDIVYKVRDKTGIKEFTYHYMRNLSVTALSQIGISTVDLSAMLGHTDINTLNKYLSIERTKSTKRTVEASLRLLDSES